MSTSLESIVAKLRERGDLEAAQITPRELEVLQLVAQGWLSKQIAAHLGSARHTVDNQRASVMQKLGANTPAHMVWIAMRRGLL